MLVRRRTYTGRQCPEQCAMQLDTFSPRGRYWAPWYEEEKKNIEKRGTAYKQN